MSFSARQLKGAVEIGVQSERLDIVDFLEKRYNQLSLDMQRAIDTSVTEYDYLVTRREEVMNIISWVLDRGEQ